MSLRSDQIYKSLNNLRKAKFFFGHMVELPPGEFFLLERVHSLSRGGEHGCPGCLGEGEQAVFVSDLHEKERMSLSAVSQLLSSLERKGLVERTMSRRDRRRIAVSITPEGQALLNRAKRMMDQWLSDLIARFGEDNTRELVALLEKLNSVIEQMRKERADEEVRP